jgi:hypothetical protein
MPYYFTGSVALVKLARGRGGSAAAELVQGGVAIALLWLQGDAGKVGMVGGVRIVLRF